MEIEPLIVEYRTLVSKNKLPETVNKKTLNMMIEELKERNKANVKIIKQKQQQQLELEEKLKTFNKIDLIQSLKSTVEEIRKFQFEIKEYEKNYKQNIKTEGTDIQLSLIEKVFMIYYFRINKILKL